MIDKDLKEYIKSGGILYTQFHRYDRYRDGGTGVLRGVDEDRTVYIDKDSNTLHRSMPTNNDNLITNPVELELIKKKIKNYLEYLDWQKERLKNLI